MFGYERYIGFNDKDSIKIYISYRILSIFLSITLYIWAEINSALKYMIMQSLFKFVIQINKLYSINSTIFSFYQVIAKYFDVPDAATSEEKD